LPQIFRAGLHAFPAKCALVALAAIFVLSAPSMAQTSPNAQATGQAPAGGALANTQYNQLQKSGPGGPAPKRDISGSWAGPIQIDSSVVPPPLTPLGQKLLSQNKPEGQYHVADTNDMFARNCDPLGFPRNMVFEIRGIAFATMADRIVVLNQYQRVWREIWMDGRELPKNVGAPEKGAPDPRYYGYSVGHWEGDNTLVVDTTGLDEKTWLTRNGYPHTANAVVHERYVRSDHNDLQLTLTLDDPKIYTQTMKLGSADFKWIPDQQLEEQMCIPSEMLQYLTIVGDPAGAGLAPDK
jgi:hypothetical protein